MATLQFGAAPHLSLQSLLEVAWNSLNKGPDMSIKVRKRNSVLGTGDGVGVAVAIAVVAVLVVVAVAAETRARRAS